MDYTFQTDDSNSSKKIWIGVFAFVVTATIVLILIVRAADKRDDKLIDEDTAADKIEEVSKEVGDNKGASQEEVKSVAPPPAVLSSDQLKPASDAVRDLIAKGQDAEQRDDLTAARAAYEEALASKDCGDAQTLIENRLGDVFIKLITSQRQMAEKIDHAIVSGDLLEKLARKYGTTSELIAKANGISNPNAIKIGDRLRILNKPNFEITVSKSQNWLLVTMNGKFFKRYTVGTGRYNRTPVGTFKIDDKIVEPSWWTDGREIPYGDKENILGTRWMRIAATGNTPPANGYGIHGTWDATSLGQQSSAGCVRMANSDVEELYTYIPKGTSVTIIE